MTMMMMEGETAAAVVYVDVGGNSHAVTLGTADNGNGDGCDTSWTPRRLLGHLGLGAGNRIVQRPRRHRRKSLVNASHARSHPSLRVFDGTRMLADDEPLRPFSTLRVIPSMVGGKGGFGSLLRTLGSRRTDSETDNIEACRDLSGRRLRHIHDEQACREWAAKAEERAAEKEAQRVAKLERAVTAPKHLFDHHKLVVDLSAKSSEVSDAVAVALQQQQQQQQEKSKGDKSKKKHKKKGGQETSNSSSASSHHQAKESPAGHHGDGAEGKAPAMYPVPTLKKKANTTKRGVKLDDDWSATSATSDNDTSADESIPKKKRAKAKSAKNA